MSAQESSAHREARALFEEANGLARRGEHARALERFRAAYALFPSPRILLNMSTTLRALGQDLEAAVGYERWFSDLTGSTALYTRTGDARAFRTVQDHFELLRAIVERHEGTIVKTMGDAVMAAFLDEAQALKAALEMQAAFPPFRAAHPEAHDAFLKIGIYAGPCYGVTANGILDYFGQSANIAARLQGAARAGQIVVPEELAARAGQSGWLGQARISETFAASLKGLADPVRAARIEVDGG